MAIDFVCGWECRLIVPGAAVTPDELHWDSTAAAGASISTTTFRTGTAALRNNCVANTANINKILARTVVSGRFYFRAAAFPLVGDGNVHIINFLNANGNLAIAVDSTGQMRCRAGTAAYVDLGSPLSTGIWYRIDFLADTSTGTASMKAQIDGGAETNATNAQVSANMTNMRFGVFVTSTCDLFFDDLIIGTATTDHPFGHGYVERNKPTRDGTHLFTAGDFGENTAGADVATNATTVWSFVDDDDLSSTADLIRQKVIRATGYVEVGFGAPPRWYPAQAINVVSSWHAATTTADTMGMKMNDGGTIKTITNEAGTGLSDFSQATICFAEKILTTAPSGGEWTPGKIGSLLIRAGYSDDITPNPYWDGVMLEIAYGPEIAYPPYTNPMPPLIAQ